MLNGGGVCCGVPVFGLGLARLSCSFRIVLAFLLLCVWWHDAMRDGEGGACYEWRGGPVLLFIIPFSVFAVTALLV